MRLKKIITTMIGVLAAVFLCCGVLTACGGGGEELSGVEVIYALEGGTYCNATRDVKRYYQIPEGGSALITPPDRGITAGEEGVVRKGYELVGWYREKKIGADGEPVYSNEWNFDRDKVNYGDEPLTLYCRWRVKVRYSYDIMYINEEGAEQRITGIEVSAGDPFVDRNNRADTLPGYTAERQLNSETGKYEIAYYSKDEKNGNLIPWDSNFKHPGGETDCAISVYVKLIKGDFVYVTTKEEFIDASEDQTGVWLCNDIDLEGETIYGFKDGNGTFEKKAFYGNNHKVSNFKLAYQAGNLLSNTVYQELENRSLCVSLFGILIDSTVKQATFENVSVVVNEFDKSRTRALFVAPIAILMKGASEVSDVTYTGTVSVGDLPVNVTSERLFIEKARPVWQAGVTTDNCHVTVTEEPVSE